MRLLPRSLFTRLVLVLLAVLVVAQLLSLAINLHERGELLSRASGLQSAQRVADIVRLLEPLDMAERRRIVRALSAPPLTVSLDQPPLVAGDKGRDAREVMFGAMLRRFLAEDRPVEVVVSGDPPFAARTLPGAPLTESRGGGMGMGMGMMPGIGMHYASPPGLSFIAQVALRDGTLVTFDSRLPPVSASWPYRMLLSLAVLLAAAIAVSLVAVRWVTRPLKRLSDAAEALGKNIERAPLEERGPLEVARAARAFNTMQARLRGYIRDRTRVLAAMSHDLKTPITRLRLRAELLEDEQARARFLHDLEEMQSMVGATLDFLRGLESGETVKPVDVTALLESLQADMRETGGEVAIEGGVSRPYPGRPQALKRCLANLLDNAIKYGKTAKVVVEDNASRLTIRICDQGPGLPPSEIEKVFEPFYRTEQSRSRETGGTGLGLTIARNIAESHGGRLELRNLAEGGLEARLELPRAVPAKSGA